VFSSWLLLGFAIQTSLRLQESKFFKFSSPTGILQHVQDLRLEGPDKRPNESRTGPLDGLHEQIQHTVYALVRFLLALGLVIDQGENHPEMRQPKD
jgi:hypothetical protein